MSSLFGNFYANIWVIDCVTKYLGAFLTVRTAYEKILPLRGRIFDRFIIRKSKCSTDFKRNDFLKKNEAYPLGALRSLKFAYRKLRISLFVELAV